MYLSLSLSLSLSLCVSMYEFMSSNSENSWFFDVVGLFVVECFVYACVRACVRCSCHNCMRSSFSGDTLMCVYVCVCVCVCVCVFISVLLLGTHFSGCVCKNRFLCDCVRVCVCVCVCVRVCVCECVWVHVRILIWHTYANSARVFFFFLIL